MCLLLNSANALLAAVFLSHFFKKKQHIKRLFWEIHHACMISHFCICVASISASIIVIYSRGQDKQNDFFRFSLSFFSCWIFFTQVLKKKFSFSRQADQYVCFILCVCDCLWLYALVLRIPSWSLMKWLTSYVLYLTNKEVSNLQIFLVFRTDSIYAGSLCMTFKLVRN